MTRKEQIEKAAMQKYPYEGGTIGMICEFSIPIFIKGAEWADCNPNKQIVKKMHDDLKTTYDVLNEMFEDYEDARLGVAYRFLGEVLEDLELLIDEEE